MKPIIKSLYVICICLVLVGCNKFKPTKQSKNSFTKVFSTVNWNNAKANKKSLKTTCSPALIKMAIANLPKKPSLQKDSHATLFSLLDDINSKYDKAIKEFDLETKLAEDTGLFKLTAKDKLLNSKINARNEKDFIKKVKTRRDGKPVNWKKKEKQLDKALALIYKDETSIAYAIESTQVNNCSVLTQHSFDVKKLTSTKITLAAISTLFFTCKCSENDTSADVSRGEIAYSSTLEATFPNGSLDLNTIVFKNIGNPEYCVTKASCCKKE